MANLNVKITELVKSVNEMKNTLDELRPMIERIDGMRFSLMELTSLVPRLRENLDNQKSKKTCCDGCGKAIVSKNMKRHKKTCVKKPSELVVPPNEFDISGPGTSSNVTSSPSSRNEVASSDDSDDSDSSELSPQPPPKRRRGRPPVTRK